MGLYRDIRFNKGTLLDTMGAVVSANTGTFSQQNKGLALDTNSSKYATYGSSLLPSGAFTVVAWVRLRGDHLSTDRAQIISTNNVVGAGSIAMQYGSNPLLYLGASNYTYFTYPIPGDKNWHCWVFTIPGSAQSDINSAQCFVDNISYAQTGLVATGGQSSRTGYIYAGGSATQTGGCMISRIKVYDNVLTRTEIDAEYEEFLNAQPINKPKRGFIQNKTTDMSKYVRDTISTTDLLSGWTFLSTWTAVGTAVINSAVTFTTIATNGIYKAALGSVGDIYNIRIKGTTTASNLNVLDAAGTTYFSVGATGAFDITRQITWAGDRQLYLQNTGAGVTTIETLTLNKVTGLIAAYNMVKNGNTLVDISGNGFNGTVDSGIVSVKSALQLGNPTGSNQKITISPTITNATVWSVSFSIKQFVNSGNYYFGVLGGASTSIMYHNNSGKLLWYDVTYRSFSGDTTVSTTTFDNFTITSTGAAMTLYKNGVFQSTITTPSNYALNPNNIGSAFSANYGFYIQDLRVYNRVLSTTEITAYNNSFVLPALVDDFSDAGADGITKTDAPAREWERVSGTWKLAENVISNTQLSIGAPNFSTNVGWNLSGATISGGIYTGTTGGLNYCTSNVTLVAGKRYKIDVNILTSSNNAKVYVGGKNTGTLPVGFSTVYVVMDTVSNQLVGFNDLVGTSDYLSITEAPQLETMTNGTKYLENVSSGVIGIPSNTAYGSYEFDWYKGADSNTFALAIVNNKNITWGGDLGGSYWFQVSSNESLRLLKGNVSDIMNTANSYIANNTWYRVRITRSTAGVFTMLIKGGAFTPTAGYDGWTLVSVSGGSGTNPVTDTTTTTSSYLVIQASTGDRVANIVIKDGIKV
jgi:hypothetical protein